MTRRDVVLVLRALGLGDFLTGVPAYRALRRACPDSELVLAAPAAYRPLVTATHAIDRLLPTTELQPIAWYHEPPRLGVDLHGNGPASRRLVAALQARRLIAFRAAGRIGPLWRAGEHEVARWCRLLTESGIPADPGDLYLDVAELGSPLRGPLASDSEARSLVLVHPGAAHASRRWPAYRFAAVARDLAGAGHPVVVTGSRREGRLVDAVAATAAHPRVRPLAEDSRGVEGLAALVASARLVVCGDTGVAHLATACRTPSVVLFGPTPPAEWGPPDTGRHTVLWRGRPDYRGDPWGTTVDPALLDISVETVLDHARERLDGAVAEY